MVARTPWTAAQGAALKEGLSSGKSPKALATLVGKSPRAMATLATFQIPKVDNEPNVSIQSFKNDPHLLTLQLATLQEGLCRPREAPGCC